MFMSELADIKCKNSNCKGNRKTQESVPKGLEIPLFPLETRRFDISVASWAIILRQTYNTFKHISESRKSLKLMKKTSLQKKILNG